MFRLAPLVLFIAATSILASTAWACPKANGVPDFNCDGEIVVTVIGDSIAYGFGDTRNKNRGGYVLRASRKMRQVTFHNEGIKGLKTRELIVDLEDAFDRGTNNSLKSHLTDADIVIVDIGRNDRWDFGPPLASWRNLKRISSKIKSEVTATNGSSPYVVIAALMLPNRGSQGPWVKELNKIIVSKSTSRNPSDLRFDLVSKRLLGSDQIHPTSLGYDALGKTFISYLVKTVPPRIARLRTDSDADGLPDVFEPEKFGTLQDNPDTDGDGKSDGDEVFVTRTNPLVAD